MFSIQKDEFEEVINLIYKLDLCMIEVYKRTNKMLKEINIINNGEVFKIKDFNVLDKKRTHSIYGQIDPYLLRILPFPYFDSDVPFDILIKN